MTPEDILHFWFGDLELPDALVLKSRAKWWFMSGPELDQEITERFGKLLLDAERGNCDAWADTAEGRLALIIVLDQFSRNIYRGSGKSFQNDDRALQLAQDGVRAGFDVKLRSALQVFFLMPYMHSEDLEVQEEGVALFKALYNASAGDLADALKTNYDFAVRHRDVIARFGRFPHRNAWLGRENTPEEQSFLDAGNTF